MNDLKNRAREVFLHLSDDKLQFGEKIKNSLTSLSGLELTDIPVKNKKWLLGELGKINAIFSKYNIETFQDYEKIASTDRKKMLNILFAMCMKIIKED